MSEITVLGIFVADISFSGPKIPSIGETILGKKYNVGPGGKGCNQAIAIARLGGNTNFISKIGKDAYGDLALKTLEKNKISTENIIQDGNQQTGVAGILVDKNTGMGSSIAEGVKNIQSEDVNVTGIIIIPADMPLIDYNAIQAFFTAHPKFPQSIIQAVDDNGPGHPVLFPRKYFKDLIMLEKETGGRGIIKKSENTKVLKFRGSIATLDLDTPEDWETWRNGRAN